MTDSPSPDREMAQGDPGDSTASRYTYQWTYAAICACAIFDDTADVAEVFCEHHEDILIKHNDGTFTGLQVKTRDPSGSPLTATEEAVLGSCCRFAQLEHAYPGRFRTFILATNHSFLSGRMTGTCLSYLLELASAASDERSIDRKLITYLTKMMNRTRLPLSSCLTALKKCQCDHGLPKLDHVKRALATTLLESWPGAKDASLPRANLLADAMILQCQKASSLDHRQALPGYLAVTPLASGDTATAIDGKRLTKLRLQRVLDGAGNATSLLAGMAPPQPSVGAVSHRILDTKLNAGGFSEVSINAAKELRDKADYKSLEWINKFGDSEGLRRHDHVRTIVLRDAADAYECTKSSQQSFGLAMQADLRRRLAARRTATSGAPVFDCLEEHLEGHAYSLTRECKVWWSTEFPIERGE